MIIHIIFNLEPVHMKEIFNGKPSKEEVKKNLFDSLRDACGNADKSREDEKQEISGQALNPVNINASKK